MDTLTLLPMVKIIKLYYQWSPIIAKAMEEDKELKAEVKELLDGALELVGGEME
jgi:hypothetical protein